MAMSDQMGSTTERMYSVPECRSVIYPNAERGALWSDGHRIFLKRSVITLTLGPDGASFSDVVASFQGSMHELERRYQEPAPEARHAEDELSSTATSSKTENECRSCC